MEGLVQAVHRQLFVQVLHQDHTVVQWEDQVEVIVQVVVECQDQVLEEDIKFF